MGLWKLGWVPLFGWCSHWVSLVLGLQHFTNDLFFSSWTHGTGLMEPTNIVAHELKSHSVCIFSAKKMAFNILGLMHELPSWLHWYHNSYPLQAQKKTDLRCAIARDNFANFKIINRVTAEHLFQTVNVLLQANFCFEFPSLKATSSLQDLATNSKMDCCMLDGNVLRDNCWNNVGLTKGYLGWNERSTKYVDNKLYKEYKIMWKRCWRYIQTVGG